MTLGEEAVPGGTPLDRWDQTPVGVETNRVGMDTHSAGEVRSAKVLPSRHRRRQLLLLPRRLIPPFRKPSNRVERLVCVMGDIIEQHQARPHGIFKIQDVQTGG